ncbi:MAG: putative hydrolase of the superfamily [Gaiellaceae bacterium]|jgi:HAD superfamily hydrolase (TIGR01549 family)|nr:putative hydrolase of the superfamily [Gaiellaceae bacterium]
MIEAILFDWNNTLVQFTWDDDLLEEGHRAGLAAAGSDQDAAEFTARYRELVLKGATPADDYGELLRELGVGVGEGDRFIDAEHEVWRPAHEALGSAQALLDSLRSRGIKTGLVANSWPDPARLLRADVETFGLTGQFDVIVFSEEVGFRKPQPEIFLHALSLLDVSPENAMFVGDRLETDVQGAARVGMATVQALWFHADDTPGIEPDFMAFTPMDVLNAVRRLAL